jgi:hypothetical protein
VNVVALRALKSAEAETGARGGDASEGSIVAENRAVRDCGDRFGIDVGGASPSGFEVVMGSNRQMSKPVGGLRLHLATLRIEPISHAVKPLEQ